MSFVAMFTSNDDMLSPWIVTEMARNIQPKAHTSQLKSWFLHPVLSGAKNFGSKKEHVQHPP